MSERINCIVPGCRRSTGWRGRRHSQWLCARHWKTVDRALREHHKRNNRRWRTVSDNEACSGWQLCVEDATIKAAMGIAS